MTPGLGKWIPLAAWLLLLPTIPCSSEDSTRKTLFKEGRRLELRISTTYEPAIQQNLLEWIEFVSNALTRVYGHWPRQQWEISIAPVSAAANDPIPWAQVHRGELDRVEFFTQARASTEELKHAWTGYHELAHLLIPYRGWGDAWFSEGLASYYQNILQARAGILTEQQMWQKLYDGYLRGRADSTFDDQDLQSVSAKMRQDGGFMRVYWSGAWYFLTADERLRQESGGKLSLDLALKKLNACCADQSMSVAQMVKKLDELNHLTLFQALYEETIASTRIPPFEPVFTRLGISITEGQVLLHKEGSGAITRRQIVVGEVL